MWARNAPSLRPLPLLVRALLSGVEAKKVVARGRLRAASMFSGELHDRPIAEGYAPVHLRRGVEIVSSDNRRQTGGAH